MLHLIVMNVWERIQEERRAEEIEEKNRRIISKLIKGNLTPSIEEVAQIMRRKYSKYGKQRNE